MRDGFIRDRLFGKSNFSMPVGRGAVQRYDVISVPNVLQSSTRRQFIQTAALGLATASTDTLSPWSRGMLDIHHISTGQGSCTFLLCPDGTSLMVDCGAYTPPTDAVQYNVGPKPNGSRRTGEWVARYVSRQMREFKRAEIDTFVLTHLHGDHAGDPRFHNPPQSKFGGYVLAGVSDLSETIPVRRVIDRAFPGYGYPAPLDDPQQANYRAFVKSLVARGGLAEKFRVGALDQIGLVREPNAFPSFHVRNLAANGEVWTGAGTETRQLFPALKTLAPRDYPTENMCSIAMRLAYGKFRYFTGGDMTFDTVYGAQPWRDIETPVAQACGHVHVAVANHHGYVDSTGPGFVAALRPRCFVINAWDSSHPSASAMNAMLSRDLYPGDRDIFSTAVKPETKIAIRQLNQLKSDSGHVVVRVHPEGERFEVLITSNSDESDTVWKKFGPYECA
jgi:beta-lactamase superfamily II metal-dependent hydrolase